MKTKGALRPDAMGKIKFSAEQINIKTNIRLARLEQGYTVGEFAEAVGIHRKKYEDLEAVRSYGCYVDWDTACKCADVLGLSLDQLRM